MSPDAWLDEPRASLADEEGRRVAEGLPPVVDAHVHLFPDRVFAAIWAWFDQHGWPIRYKIPTPAITAFLLGHGIDHLVALHYAHKPGMARMLNSYMAGVCKGEPRVTGLATVLPGEPDAEAILEEAFAAGLRGVKLHTHVQCFAADEDRVREVYEACVRHDLPLVIHAGREPKSPAYHCDPHVLCSADRIDHVLEEHPRLRVCVPHLGADEFDAYIELVERHDNLWLDTTMAFAGYFPGDLRVDALRARPDRVMYGTDFPNIPYAWDRELRTIAGLGLGDEDLAKILGGTARAFFGIGTHSA